MCTIASPTSFGVHRRLDRDAAVGLRHALGHSVSAISVSALPMSIWPQAMSNGRPSSAIDFVRPVIACLVAV